MSFTSPSELVGASPPFAARPVSIAVRDYLRQRTKQSRGPYGVVVAVSGGADSLSLSVAAADCCERMGIPLAAFVVDHQMREGSEDEAKEVVQRLGDLGIRSSAVLTACSHKRSETSISGGGLEGTAREVRHDLLESAARQWGSATGLVEIDILFGHTLDDQAETVLLRLGRGASSGSIGGMRVLQSVEGDQDRGGGASENARIFADSEALTSFTDSATSAGSAGAGGFASSGALPNFHVSATFTTSPESDTLPMFLNRGRPLLNVRRKDTEGFCESLGLPVVNDPTNRADGPWRTRSGAALPRSAVRERVLPELTKALGQDPAPALARVAKLLQEDEEALEHYAQQVLLEATQEEDLRRVNHHRTVQIALSVNPLKQCPKAVRMRALADAAKGISIGGLNSSQLGALEELLSSSKNAQGKNRRVCLPGGATAYRQDDLVILDNSLAVREKN